MSLRRLAGLSAITLATLLWIACGEVYRPVVLPINTTPPNPANAHAVFAISADVPFNQGTAMQIDVSGDSDIGVANMGVNPTHAAVSPNNFRVFVTSAGSQYSGVADVVTSFTPDINGATTTGLSSLTTFTLPNYGPNQSAGISGISEASNSDVVTVTLTAPLLAATVGDPVVISGVVIPGTNITNPAAYDGNFSISSISGNTIQYLDVVNNVPITGLPAVGAGGTAAVPLPTYCSYLPDFVTAAQTSAVYFANFGTENGANCTLASTDSVAMINPVLNTITNIQYLPAGSHPVAMVETPDAQNLYVLNQGSNSITDLSPLDLSVLTTITFPAGSTNPAWATARVDGKRVYVVTQGDGKLYTIHTDTNQLDPVSLSVGGPGANLVVYDSSHNRIYVTNPNAAAVYVFQATTDPPTALATIPISAPSVPATGTNCATYTCTYQVMPVSIAALPDGSRFYVAIVTLGTATCLPGDPCYPTPPTPPPVPTCPDPNVTAPGCVIPQVTVFDALSLSLKTTVFPIVSEVANPVGGNQPFAMAPVTFCAPMIPYTPAATRFRMAAAAAADSSKVYTALCDGGTVAIVNTTTSSVSSGQNNAADTLEGDLPTPFSAAPIGPNGPPTQYPVFLLTGR